LIGEQMKFKILIVDDVEQNIHSLKMLIEDSFDILVYSVQSAQEGVSFLIKQPVDLILSDIHMPDINGFEFVEYIKGIDRLKNIPIIFITAVYSNLEYQKKGYGIGAIDYITKPIDADILSQKLKIFIDIFEKEKLIDIDLEDKNKILISQSKMAAMGEMIGIISHQLKQPLTILSLCCDDVKLYNEHFEIDDEFIDTFTKQTNQQIRYMTDTIDRFREFFNPNKRKENFLLKDSVENGIKLLDKLLVQNNTVIDINVGNEQIFGLKDELTQVLINLISNSQDAFIENKIKDSKILIESKSYENHIILSVEDNGGGISKNIIDNIFNPYFTTKQKGTGTGLFMVNLIISTSFKGGIKAYNTSKSGTKFIITLPSKM